MVLSAGLFMAEFRDAVKEGDGSRMDRVWKYLLIFFRSSGKTKYALEALYLQFQKLTLSPRLQKQLLWSRFVNSRGGVGHNILAHGTSQPCTENSTVWPFSTRYTARFSTRYTASDTRAGLKVRERD